jgi:homocysteine S-methyltransferase
MQSDGRALAALPNIGLASLSGGRVIYPHATPEYFAEFAAQARALGAKVIGGCCGTTPLEIEAIARAVEEERKPTAPFATAERELVVAAHERPEETELARMLRAGEWVTCVELDPPKGGTYESMLAVTQTLKDSGHVGFVDINDNPMARARANALMAAVAIERSCGIGDPPHVGDYPGSRGVYEVDSIGLSQLIARLNTGEDFNGKAIDGPTSFFLGVAVNPSADDLETELERFRRKVDAGAQFAMTQALFDLSYLDRFAERLGGWPIPILVGIFLVRSHQLAVRLHNEVPGIVVPEAVQQRLLDAGPAAADEGVAIARELYGEARGLAAGAYVIPPFKQPEAALDLLR